MKHVWNSIKPYGLWEAHPSAALWGVFWKSSQLDRRIHFPIYLNEKIAWAFLQSLLANIWPWLKMNLHSCYELYLGMLPLPMEKCENLIIQYKKVFQLICASKTLKTQIWNVFEEMDQNYFIWYSPTVFCCLTPSYLHTANIFFIKKGKSRLSCRQQRCWTGSFHPPESTLSPACPKKSMVLLWWCFEGGGSDKT